MKNLALALIFTCFTAITAFSQQVAVIDVNQVLNAMPAYQNAQQKLNTLAEEWQQEIAEEMDEIKSMYNKYQADQVLLSNEEKVRREEEIMEREKQVREMQRERFGPEGALFEQRQELIAPIQEKIYGAIEDYAQNRNIDIIIDKTSNAGLIFVSDTYDRTNDILKALNLN